MVLINLAGFAYLSIIGEECTADRVSAIQRANTYRSFNVPDLEGA